VEEFLQEFLLNNACGTFHGSLGTCISFVGAGAQVIVRDRVEEGFWWNLDRVLWEFLLDIDHWWSLWQHGCTR